MASLSSLATSQESQQSDGMGSQTLPTGHSDSEQAASSLSFAGFCRVLEAVEHTPKPEAKIRLVFSDQLRSQLQGGNLYPLLRLLVPFLDRERTYNVKEKKIAKLFVEILGMAKESKDAQKLEHFNDPTIVDSKSVGDFAAVLYDVLKYRTFASSSRRLDRSGGGLGGDTTIGFVNELLDRVVNASDNKSRKQVFMELTTKFPAQEIKWIVRILLKDLKIGLRHERLLSFIHPDAMEMYNHTNDLRKVCRELRNSNVRYTPQIEPFQVFSPMLAKRVEFGECIAAINTDRFVMEPKLDGERVTCHIKYHRGEDASTPEVQFISRNGTNYTQQYGPAISPYIVKQVLSGLDCILDGEMMIWDNLEYKYREFGMLKNVANAFRSGDPSMAHLWLCYVVWDIVYLEGDQAQAMIRDAYKAISGEVVQGVMGLPLFARRELLEKMVTPLDHRVVLIEQKLVDSKSPKERHEMVMAEVDCQIANGGEGVILKDLNAHYMCGESGRKTKRWIKLKPDYAGMTTDLDVIILGGFYGTGRRRSGDVSVFMCGVLSHSLTEDAVEKAMQAQDLRQLPCFYTFTKVGTGYNLEELAQLRNELEPHWQVWGDLNDESAVPPFFNGWKPQRNDLKPDVWIDPRKSKILEIYGFELSFTQLYQTGLTLRFPRVKAIRHDKPWFECVTVQDLNVARGSLTERRATDVALGSKHRNTLKRKRKESSSKADGLSSSSLLRRRPGGTGHVLEDFAAPKLDNILQLANVFDSKEFCVLPGKYDLTQNQREQLQQKTLAKEIESIVCRIGGPKANGKGENGVEDKTPIKSSLSKHDLEQLLHAFGGKLVQNPMAGTTSFVIGTAQGGLKLQNLKKQGLFDIVQLDWLLRCICSKQLVALKARDLIFATPQTQAMLQKHFDAFGDHFTEPVTSQELQLLLGQMSSFHGHKPWQEALRELTDEEMQVMDTSSTFLGHCRVYFFSRTSFHQQQRKSSNTKSRDKTIELADKMDQDILDLYQQKVRLFGGMVMSQLDKTVTHVVLVSHGGTSIATAQFASLQTRIRELRHRFSREPTVVTKEWVDVCVQERQQAQIETFFVPI